MTQIISCSMCVFEVFIKSSKELTIHISSFFLHKLWVLHLLCSSLGIVGGRDDMMVDAGVWFVAVIFVRFIPLHWRLSWWMFELSMVYVRLAVDIVNFKRCFIWYQGIGFEDGLTPFNNDENVLVMCIEQNLSFKATCTFLYLQYCCGSFCH